jgi:choline dehydrogenase-like flavoprotein
VSKRTNLTVLTDTRVTQIVFAGKRATGVRSLRDGVMQDFHCKREIVLSAGAIMSPALLQLSGVGPGAHLRELGIPVVADLPGVGSNMREHRYGKLQWRLNRNLSQNAMYHGLGLVKTVLRYMLFKKGPLAQGAYQVGVFYKARPASPRADAELLMAPFSLRMDTNEFIIDDKPGITAICFALRPESQGSVMIQSPDAMQMPVIRPNYLTAAYDREVAIGAMRHARHIASLQPLAGLIETETLPGAAAQSDEHILSAFSRYGGSGYHAVGTCKMGRDDMAVVDSQLRVRGTEGLRVMDCSVAPFIISGNTNGPMMAMAWRAADLIIAASGDNWRSAA